MLGEVENNPPKPCGEREKGLNQETVRSKLSALYEAKRAAGLVDVKFFVGNRDEASFEEVAEEVLRLEEAVRLGEYRVIKFNDKRV